MLNFLFHGRHFVLFNTILAIFFIHIRPNAVNANQVFEKLLVVVKTHLPLEWGRQIGQIGKKEVKKMDENYEKIEEVKNLVLEEEQKGNIADERDLKKQTAAEEAIVLKKMQQKHHLGKFKTGLNKIFKWRLNGKKYFLDNLHACSRIVQAILTGKWSGVNAILPNLKKMIKNVQQVEFEAKKKQFKLIEGEIKPLNLSDSENLSSILRMSIEKITGKWRESPESWKLYFAAGKAVTDDKFEFHSVSGKEKPPTKPWYSALLFGHDNNRPLLKAAASAPVQKHLRRSKRQLEGLIVAACVIGLYFLLLFIFSLCSNSNNPSSASAAGDADADAASSVNSN